MRLACAVLLAGTALACGQESAPAAKAPPAPDGRQARGEWLTYHGGYSLDGVADAAPPDAPELLWKFKAGQPIEATPVSAGGRIFFATVKGSIFALDLRGGKIWTSEIAKDFFSSPLMVADDLVIGGTSNGLVYAYDAATGRERWKYDVGGSVQGTANRVELEGGKKGVVVISQGDGALHGLELETGKPAWKTEAVDRCDGSPGVGNGRVAMGSCASALHVFTIGKEPKRTDIPLGGDQQVAGGVAISGKTAFAGTRSGKFCAIDLAEGKIAWTNEDCKKEAFTTPAVNDRVVLFGADDGKIYALDRRTGGKDWEFDTGKKPASPVIAGARAVVSSGGSLFLLDLKGGGKIWSAAVSDQITSPALVGGMILVGGDDGTVTAYGRK